MPPPFDAKSRQVTNNPQRAIGRSRTPRRKTLGAAKKYSPRQPENSSVNSLMIVIPCIIAAVVFIAWKMTSGAASATAPTPVMTPPSMMMVDSPAPAAAKPNPKSAPPPADYKAPDLTKFSDDSQWENAPKTTLTAAEAQNKIAEAKALYERAIESAGAERNRLHHQVVALCAEIANSTAPETDRQNADKLRVMANKLTTLEK